MRRLCLLLLSVSASAWLAACAPIPAAGPTGISELAERPPERALLAGIRAYEDGQYADAERQLTQALQLGLASPKDQAAAHKYLAFVYCTSQRPAECEAAFRAARRADPAFTLSRSEAGHPMWGPVFTRSQQP
jgi:Tfp pilus assembly protein PilF